MSTCRICHSEDLEPLFQGPADRALTSTMGRFGARLSLWLCRACGHLQNGDELRRHLDQYYASSYSLYLDDAESQELFFDAAGRPVPKTAVHLGPFQALLAGRPAGRVLDMGAGKGLMAAAVKAAFPQWDVHAFEVSERYSAYLRDVLPEDRIILGDPMQLAAWEGRFDVIALFDVLEHLDAPVEVLRQVRRLLAPGGVVYLHNPEITGGELDWLIVDHLSHFTVEAAGHAVALAGLEVISAERDWTPGSLQIVARDSGSTGTAAPSAVRRGDDVARARTLIADHIDYWSRMQDMAAQAVELGRVGDRPIAIFGTGTAASALAIYCPELDRRVSCFIDENPWRIGGTHLDRPVVAPADLPADLACVVLGVSRRNAPLVRDKLAPRPYPILAQET